MICPTSACYDHKRSYKRIHHSTSLANNSPTESANMNNQTLQSILQGFLVPDFIYRPADGALYFTRPSRPSGSISYGHDSLTNLPLWDLTYMYVIPVGASMHEIAPGVYVGAFRATVNNGESIPWTLRQVENHQLPPVPVFGSSHLGTNVSNSYERNAPQAGHSHTGPSSVGGPRTSDLRNGFVAEPVRAGSSYAADPPRTSSYPPGFSATAARILEAKRSNSSSSIKEICDALFANYQSELKAESGHHFDNVDDNVIVTYINACKPLAGLDTTHEVLTIGRDTGERLPSWYIYTPFLGLRQTTLKLFLPLDQASVRALTNDLLRVLHVHLATADQGPLMNPTDASKSEIAEARKEVQRELKCRGFTKQMPHMVRLSGLRSSPNSADADTSVDATSSSKTSDCQPVIVQPSNSPKTTTAEKPCGSNDSCKKKLRLQIPRVGESSSVEAAGEAAENKMGKTPVCREHQADSSDHSSAATSSGAKQTEHDDRESEHSESRVVEIVSPASSSGSSEEIESDIDGSSPSTRSRANSKESESKVDASPGKSLTGIAFQTSDY